MPNEGRVLERCADTRDQDEMNPELEKAGRVADFIEIGELMARDALHREESCGGHFREEYQTEEGEALRNDERLHVCFSLGIQR